MGIAASVRVGTGSGLVAAMAALNIREFDGDLLQGDRS
jgi:hypothetical protein